MITPMSFAIPALHKWVVGRCVCCFPEVWTQNFELPFCPASEASVLRWRRVWRRCPGHRGRTRGHSRAHPRLRGRARRVDEIVWVGVKIIIFFRESCFIISLWGKPFVNSLGSEGDLSLSKSRRCTYSNYIDSSDVNAAFPKWHYTWISR